MKGLSSRELRHLILSVGTRKMNRPLSPVEVGKLIQRALNAGEKRATIADKLYLDDPNTIIMRFIRLLSLPVEVQNLVGWGSDSATLSFTSAAMIARLESPQDQRNLATAVLENRFSKSEIIQIIQIRQRSRKPLETCITNVLNQRPVVERKYVIIGELRSIRLTERLKHFSQIERDGLLESTLKANLPHIRGFGCKLGDRFFFLVGDEQFHDQIVSLPGGFEESITKYLTLGLDVEEHNV